METFDFELTQPAISEHLVRPAGLVELDSFLAEIMPSRLERLKAAAERAEQGGRYARVARRN